MKRIWNLGFAALISFSLPAAIIAQGNGQNPPQKNGEPPTQKGEQKSEQRAEEPRKDPVEDLRKANAGGRNGPREAAILFDTISAKKVRVGTEIKFKVYARAKVAGRTLIYTIIEPPEGAQIDPYTGDFKWVPTVAALYTVTIAASDPSETGTTTKTTFTAEILKPMEVFGHTYFAVPRAAIIGRLSSFQNGLARPGMMVNAAPGFSSFLPQGSDLQNMLKSAQGNGQLPFPAGFQGPPAPLAGAIGRGQGTATPPDPKTEGTSPAQVQGGGLLVTPTQPQNPQNQQRPPDQISPQLVNAQQYMVGPFDMLSSNVFVPAPDRYQVGPGDVLVIRYWSPTLESREVTAVIDGRGAVGIPTSGRRIVVRGKTLDRAEDLIGKEIKRDLVGADVSVTLKELRTFPLTVTGEAFLPGTYQVPAVATLFTALYMCGGPTENGSFRKIGLRRSDGTTKLIDLYKFLIGNDASQDVPLQPGDSIHFPASDGKVTIDGEVGVPAIYEVISGEKLKDVLKHARGAKPSGVTQRIGHSTVEPGKGLLLRDVDLSAMGNDSNPPVYPGDTITIYSVRPVITNVVTLDGAVDQPGNYALSTGMTVRDLIARARGPIEEANLARADLFRRNEDGTIRLLPVNLAKAIEGDAASNVKLEVFDRLVVYRVDETKWMGDRVVQVAGAIRKPGDYARADGMKVLDLVLQAGGLNGDAFLPQGFVQRVKPDGTFGELIKIDFQRAAIGDPAHNVILEDRDRLRVQTQAEAVYTPDQEVTILGAVQATGRYPSSSNLTVKDLLALAGGTKPEVGDKIEIGRARVPEGTAAEVYDLKDITDGKVNPKLNPGDLVSVSTRSDFQAAPRTVFVLGAVNRPGPYTINSSTDRITDIIGRAGGLTPTGFARGAQFSRDPKKLKTLFQASLSPRIREVIEIIAEDEYSRALAKSEVEKARVAKSINQGNPGIAIPGLGSVGSQGTSTPINIESGDVVTRARKLRPLEYEPSGNVSIRLDEALRNPKSSYNLVLEQGDYILIPEKPATVQVGGAVFVNGSIAFQDRKDLNWYLERSGGLMPDASTKLIFIIRANGEVVRGKGSTRIEVGDNIFVPTRVMAERLTDRQAEVDALSRNITSAGVMISIIRALGGK